MKIIMTILMIIVLLRAIYTVTILTWHMSLETVLK